MESTVKRGDIYYADLSPVVGSEQGGTRPVLIVQNDMGNRSRSSTRLMTQKSSSRNTITSIRIIRIMIVLESRSQNGIMYSNGMESFTHITA